MDAGVDSEVGMVDEKSQEKDAVVKDEAELRYKTFLAYLCDLIEDKINAERYDEGVRQLLGNQVPSGGVRGKFAIRHAMLLCHSRYVSLDVRTVSRYFRLGCENMLLIVNYKLHRILSSTEQGAIISFAAPTWSCQCAFRA